MKQTLKSSLLSAVLLAAGICTVTADDDINRKTYENPVIPSSTPDPTIIKCEEDGFYYLYGTEDTRNMPIYRSKNLVDWIFVGTAFNEASRPACVGPNSGAGLWAPDINYINGQYVLYFSIGVWGQTEKCGVGVATSDRPEGPFEYYGCVHHADGTPFNDKVLFDPAVINDDGTIRLYFGTSYFLDEGLKFPTRSLYAFIEGKIFNRPAKSLKNGDKTGAWHIRLADDMVTVLSEPSRVVPNRTKGTPFGEHAFFEGASIRKFNGLYYFIYSSRKNHELCYATSKYPDRGFQYGGTIVSNGDVGCRGRKKKAALTGNNHGSMEKVGDKYYIFYHRMTDKSTYSRQACAEEVKVENDGSIKQVAMTSCGLNGAALKAEGEYPAAIACNLYKGKMPHVANGKKKKRVPYITKSNGDWVIADISGGTVVGYKNFAFDGSVCIGVVLKGKFKGRLELYTDEKARPTASICINVDQESYKKFSFPELKIYGDKEICLHFLGKGSLEFSSVFFTNKTRL